MSAEQKVNGSLSPDSSIEMGGGEDALQKLQKDVSDLRENLRLRRSRNLGPEGIALHVRVYNIIYT